MTRTLRQATRLPFLGILSAGLVLAVSCGDDDSSGDTSDLASETEAVVKRSMQALIEGDDAAYFEELHPDYRDDPSRAPDANLDLRGCKIDRVRVPDDIEGENSTVIFEEPCGSDSTDPSKSFVGCSLSVALVDGRPYTLNYACTS